MAGVASMESAVRKLEQASELLAEARHHMGEAPPPTYLRHDYQVEKYERNLRNAQGHCASALQDAKLGCIQASLALEELERYRR